MKLYEIKAQLVATAATYSNSPEQLKISAKRLFTLVLGRTFGK